MLKKEYLYGFNDVTLPPYYLTNIQSRSDIQDINKLLYTAPMDTVVGSMESLERFYAQGQGIKVITVRGFWKKHDIEDFKYPYRISITLSEFEQFIENKESDISLFLNEYKQRFGHYIVLVDLANGHMNELYQLSKRCKEIYKDDIDLMIGNIAHPITYNMYADIGVDSIRLSIGTGAACLTSAKTSIHYPAISLIDECKKIKDHNNYHTKIIMDGGIKDSSYIIKALAAGADGVMMGSMFNKCLESSGEKRAFVGHNSEIGENPLSLEQATEMYKNGVGLYVQYRGMSTNAVQEKENGSHRNYEEGLSTYQTVEYTLSELLYELNYSIKSAFSYCNAFSLQEFYENSELYLVTPSKNHNSL